MQTPRFYTPFGANIATSSAHIFFGSQWERQERSPTTMVEGQKNIKKSEKALSQADFPKNPVISFSVLRARFNRQNLRILAVFTMFYKLFQVSIFPVFSRSNDQGAFGLSAFCRQADGDDSWEPFISFPCFYFVLCQPF